MPGMHFLLNIRQNLGLANASRRIAVSLVAIVFTLQFGCATPGRAVSNTWYQTTLGKVALIASVREPDVNFEGFARSKGEGAAVGAGVGFASCVQMLLDSNCEGAICGAVVILWLGVCGVVSGVGALVGTTAAPSADFVKEAEAGMTAILNANSIQESLRGELAAAALSSNGARLMELPPKNAQSAARTQDYRPLSALGVDTVIETTVTKAGSRGSGINAPLLIYLQAHVRVIHTDDNSELFSSDYEYLGERRTLHEWSANGGERLVRALNIGFQSLGSHIHDSVFLLYPFPNRDPQWGGLLVFVYGLEPVFPALRGVLTDDPLIGAHFEWVTIDTLQPTFQWQRFPRKTDIETAPEEMGRVRNTRYDIVIARERNLAPAEIVYRRDGLLGTSHEVALSLHPDTRYFWTVRARFELDGRERVTEWGSTHYTARERFTAPSRFSYRFKTR